MRKIVFLVLILIPLSVFSKTIWLTHAVIKKTPNQSDLTFTFSSPVTFHAFGLMHPKRYIVDFPGAKSLNPLRFDHFRYATHPDNMRMVFLLDSNARATLVAHQYNPNRIDIVIYKSNSFSLPTPEKEALPVVVKPMGIPVSTHYRNVVIVIDPGHGGKDPGAIGLGGTQEKNVVLIIAKKLQQLINHQPGYTAYLTRTGDYYLTLRQRLKIARQDKADMFIAIHADTWRNKQARGVSVFALSQRGATSEAARWLATRENASELMGGVELNDQSHLLKSVLINLSQSATIRSSLQIGDNILDRAKPIAHLHHNHVEQAAFVVLKSPDIPSLLVETGFLSNSHEESLLNNRVYQNELSEALMQGIRSYFQHYPPRGTWLNYWRDHGGVSRHGR